jgi:hypothetical protein
MGVGAKSVRQEYDPHTTQLSPCLSSRLLRSALRKWPTQACLPHVKVKLPDSRAATKPCAYRGSQEPISRSRRLYRCVSALRRSGTLVYEVVRSLRREIVKSVNLGAWACGVLGFAWAIAEAQTTAQSAPRAPTAPMDAPVMSPRPAQAETPTATDASQTDTSRVDKATDPETPTASHDAVTGRDLPAPSPVRPPNAVVSHPDFKTLDVNNRGYLTSDDVAQNRWLASNFSRCDANHDGRLSQQEFANCK